MLWFVDLEGKFSYLCKRLDKYHTCLSFTTVGLVFIFFEKRGFLCIFEWGVVDKVLSQWKVLTGAALCARVHFNQSCIWLSHRQGDPPPRHNNVLAGKRIFHVAYLQARPRICKTPPFCRDRKYFARPKNLKCNSRLRSLTAGPV